MKPALRISILFILLTGCKTQIPSPVLDVGDDYIKTIDIDFYLKDRVNYAYQFRITNQSKDTLSIFPPRTHFGYCYFRLIDPDGKIFKGACSFVHIAGYDSWMDLPPGKSVIIDGYPTIKAFLCDIRPDQLIGYIYNGAIKKKSETGSYPFYFEILPTKASEIDTISIRKTIF